MLLLDLFESDEDHARALQTNGYWGNQGAGCLFVAKSTGRFLLAHRSVHVEQPGTWGVFGGAIDSGEDPAAAALREAEEESGYNGKIKMIPMYVFNAERGGKVVFKYFNFLAIVPDEFAPHLNWESQGFKWCDFGNWPSPLHFGVLKLLSDPKSINIMKELSKM
jgi:8-oxo-dGTP pyrophosphatase MutT (NUDIX family)